MSGKDFDGVADTLYIPLAARVYVSKRFPEYFFDPKSLELEAAIPGDSIQKGSNERYRGAVVDSTLLPKVKVEVIVSKISVDSVIEAAKKALYTGHIGDGKIFVYNVTRVVKIRTGEEDFAALQDVE